MSILQPTGPSPAQEPLATQEVGGMLERMDAQGQVTERLLLSLGDWQVIPDDQGKLRVLDAMHVTPRPALLRLRVWRTRIGVAWQAGPSGLLPDGLNGGHEESRDVSEKQKLIDCETDLQSGGERFRLIPAQQTIQTAWTPPAPKDAPAATNAPTATGSLSTAQSWKESVGNLARSIESIQAMVERWYGEAQQRWDLELSKDRLRSLSSHLAFCGNQCKTLGDLLLVEANAARDGSCQEDECQPQPTFREEDGELVEARHAALGLWTSLCADPIELHVAPSLDSVDPDEDRSWKSREDRWDARDSSTEWGDAPEPIGGLVKLEPLEELQVEEAGLQVELRREESMREWLQGHFEGRHEEFLLLEQLLFQQPSRRSRDASGEPESTIQRKSGVLEQDAALCVEPKQDQPSGGSCSSTAVGRADCVSLLFGCFLILSGIGMWNLNLSAWNSKFAGVVSGVIGSLWLVDSIFRLRNSGRASTSSIEA